MKMPSQNTRAYVYRVSVAALPLLVLIGLVSQDAVPAIVSLLAAALLPALAAANTPTDGE